MNELMNFRNDEFGEIRTTIINDEPWFVGKDVTNILGYQNGSRDINNHVDDEDRLKYQIGTSGQMREHTLINESGLYSLILSSKMPNAKKFKRWVTSEVLPSIRKQGFYASQELSKELKAIIWLDKQQQQLTRQLEEVNGSITEFKENIPLFAIECENLNKAIKKKATDSLGGYQSAAYNDKSLRGKVYADIHGEIRRQFGVSSYKAIKRTQYDKALNVIQGYRLPMTLSEDIEYALS